MSRGKFSVTGETTLLAKLAGDFKACEWIYRFGANPGMPRGGVLPPTPVLAPEPALGSRPRVALSSAQAGAMYCRPGPAGNPRLDQVLNHGRNNSTGTASPERDRLPGPSPRGELPARCGVQCSRRKRENIQINIQVGGLSATGLRQSEATDLSCHLSQKTPSRPQGSAHRSIEGHGQR